MLLFQCTVEFEFQCINNSARFLEIGFQYKWGSKEYAENINSEYSDVFAFFLNGVNIAKLTDGTDVGVSSVNYHNNSHLFNGNDG